MIIFSNDVDILRYEPILFGELYLQGQVLAAGTGGELEGTTFTVSDADFVNSRVYAGGVVYFSSADGLLDGAFEIVSVDSTTEFTVSVLRANSDEPAVAPPTASDISYRISTFRPQAAESGLELAEYFGIVPGSLLSDLDIENILDTETLRRASVFAVISAVYAMLGSKAQNDNFWKKSLHYRRLFEKARERCRFSIDSSGDGAADITKVGGVGRLVRD